MRAIYIQAISFGAAVLISIGLGILFKKYPSKSFAELSTPIIHVIFVIMYGIPLYSFYKQLIRNGFTQYDKILGIPLLPFHSSLHLVGTVTLLLGIFICLISILTLFDSGRGLPGIVLSEKLAAKGIYSLTRNPMSLGFYSVLISIGLRSGSTFVTVWSLLVIIPTHVCFLKFFEERELTLRFGQPYLEYREKVPFIIPNFRIITRGVFRIIKREPFD